MYYYIPLFILTHLLIHQAISPHPSFTHSTHSFFNSFIYSVTVYSLILLLTPLASPSLISHLLTHPLSRMLPRAYMKPRYNPNFFLSIIWKDINLLHVSSSWQLNVNNYIRFSMGFVIYVKKYIYVLTS